MSVAATETVTVGWSMLGGVAGSCNTEAAGDAVRIELASKRAVLLVSVYDCPAIGDAGSDAGTNARTGQVVQKTKAEVTLTDAQRDSLLATANRIELTNVDDCLGYDGKSFTVAVDRGAGKIDRYTDGISFGCDVVASGQSTLYNEAKKLFP